MPPNIRRVRVSDAAAITQIMQDPAAFPGVLQLPYASEEMWRERIERGLKEGSNDLLLVAEVNGAVVGNAGLNPVGTALRRLHCRGLGIAVAGTHQGTGVGSALMAALLDYADNWANVLRVELTVYSDNAAGIALYEKFGFVREGVHRAYALRAGKYVDAVSMARLHPNPPVLAPAARQP
jgi:L-phenylalanine/L-methionine N-acetyltransferase